LPEWLIEHGIGESRAVLIEDGDIVEALIQLHNVCAAGSIVAARLTSVGANGRNAVVADEHGREYLLPRGAAGVTEGAPLTIEVTREAIPGTEPWKRPLAKASSEPVAAAPVLSGSELPFPSPQDRLAGVGWNDLLEEARSGIVRFAGGELRISPTPAMTLIDVDGSLPSDELAVRGAAEAAKIIRRLQIGGSIGIDLPTSGSKRARQEAAEAIDEKLPGPFERTAVNGFGFVQIVRPRQRASLVELAQDRASFEARALLRQAAFERAGAKRLVAHPAVVAVLESHKDWAEALSRQLGGTIELRADAALPMSGGYAQKI
jgi:ribonuclease G